ncbi:type VI secretion system-associated protein TagF [Pseudomonas indica]|uniref:type VI secretion system-associated protein TagF n=1 Tax=Pseudomonas indica TaxID=137658 RepID=UPI003FD0C13D
MTTPGFYGKLAGRGDFMHRDLPPTFIEAWDAWLAAGMAASQAELGAGWLDAYLVSPLWRFAVAPGLLGGEAVTGVMMPSIDRVGRYFPLTIVVLLPADSDLAALVSGPDDWYERAEALLLSTLGDEADVEAFEAAVTRLGTPSCAAGPAWREGRDGHWQVAAATPQARGAALGQLACEGVSFWWGKGSERVPAGLLRYRGLPGPQGFVGFLVGEGGQPSVPESIQSEFGIL